jgi:hypothetical protein
MLRSCTFGRTASEIWSANEKFGRINCGHERDYKEPKTLLGRMRIEISRNFDN